jgi:hypothetical protein
MPLLIRFRTLWDMSICNTCAFPHLRQCPPLLTRRKRNVNKMRQWMLCRAFGVIAISTPRQTASQVPLPGINSMPRSAFLPVICSKIIWAYLITSLLRMYRSLSRPRRSKQPPASVSLLRLTRLRLHCQTLQIQQHLTNVPEPTLAIGNLAPRHLRRATS